MKTHRAPLRAAGAALAVALGAGCLGVGYLVFNQVDDQPPAIVKASEQASEQASAGLQVADLTLTGTAPAAVRTGGPVTGVPSSVGGSGSPSGGSSGSSPSTSAGPSGGAEAVAAEVDVHAAFGAARRFPYASCPDVRLLTDRAGVVRGLLRCTVKGTSTLVYAELTAGRWTTQLLGAGLAPGGVADDGTATYGLYQTTDSSPDLWLLRRTHAGAVSRQLVKRSLATAVNESALVASGGRWWAVWTELNGGSGTRLWTARTLFGTEPATATGLVGRSPSMVLDGDKLVVAYTGGYRPEGNTVYTVTATATGWSAPESLSGGVKPYDDVASSPTVALIGGALTIAYRHRTVHGDFAGVDDVVVARWSGSSWVRNTLEAYAAGPPMLFDSGGRPLVIWTQLKPRLSGSTWHVESTFGCLSVLGPDGWVSARLPGTVTTKPTLLGAATSGGRIVTLVQEYPSPGLVSLQQ